MIRSKEELLSILKDRIGEDTSDEAISFVEDVTDTINDYETKAQTDWEQKYNDMKTKYRDRFFSGDPVKPEPEEDIDDAPKTLKFEDLFKEG